MSDVGKKKKTGDLIGSAMDDLASDESLINFDDQQEEASVMSSNEEVAAEDLLDLGGDAQSEAPAGLSMNDFLNPQDAAKEEAPAALSEPEPDFVAQQEALKKGTKKPILIEELPSEPEPELKTAIVESNLASEFADNAETFSEGGEKTVVVGSSGQRNDYSDQHSLAETKDVFGVASPFSAAPAVLSSSVSENQIVQIESLKLAQNKISEIEKELESLRAENESLSSSATFARDQMNELNEKLQRIEADRAAANQQFQSEVAIYRDTISNKDFELNKLKQKNAELDGRIQKDLRKIRVRERELENRLELLKLEKEALLKSKDETILELKTKLEQATHDLGRYQRQVAELTQKMNEHHQQMTRTARSLRLALTSIEASEESKSASVTPLKKAE